MPWPPTLPPLGRTNDTVQANNHPSDHNLLTQAVADVWPTGVPKYGTIGDLNAGWPAPPNGALAVTTSDNALWQRIAGAWVPAPGWAVSATAYKVDQGVGASSWTPLTWAGTTHAQGVALTANELVATYAGVYLIRASAVFSGVAGGAARLLALERPESGYVLAEGSHPPQGANPVTVAAGVAEKLPAGGRVRARVYTDAAATIIGATGTGLGSSFSISRLGG